MSSHPPSSTVCRNGSRAPTIDRLTFYDRRAEARPRESARHYNELVRRFYRFLVPRGVSVLELGCGVGDLLGAIEAHRRVGVDFSPAMIELARQRHPQCEFHVADVAAFDPQEQFDCLIMSDLVNDLEDVQAVLSRVQQFAHERSRLIINFFNYLWHPILSGAERLGLKAPTPPQNWLSRADMQNLLYLAGWETIKVESRILWPMHTPGWERLMNRWLAPLLRHFCLTIFFVARPQRKLPLESEYRCSVIIPVRNEAGNVEAAVQRTPELGLGTELIFVEGGSTDGTWEEVQRVAERYGNERTIKVLKQQSRGKGGAVREGFAAASGDLLLILDGDLTVPPEELEKFYEIARSGIGEFVNGVRLVYPMENQAMRFLNLIANKAFSLAFSTLLGQEIKDTLCGTKVLFRSDYDSIAANRSYFGEFDPFGDFDLLFGAAKLNLKIVDLPIRYRARTYGETNIQRWKHGLLLCRMVLFAARRLKFLP